MAEKIVRLSTIPVLTVHDRFGDFSLNQVLIPIDFSESSHRSLRYTLEMQKIYNFSLRKLVFTINGKMLLGGTEDSRVLIWDSSSLKLLYSSPILGGKINSIDIHPSGEKYLVALSSGDVFEFKV